MAVSKAAKNSREDTFFSRDLSWVEFNARVLEEALDETNPPLERLKFMAIVSSNFDEFFMVRVASLKQLKLRGAKKYGPSRLTPGRQLSEIARRCKELIRLQYDCLNRQLLPTLAAQGLHFVRPADYTREQSRHLDDLFDRAIFPTLTPLVVDGNKGLPTSGNLRLYAAFVLAAAGEEAEPGRRQAIVQIPASLDRFIELPTSNGERRFALLEDVVVDHASKLFPGYEPREHAIFQVTRDADMTVDEERDEDFVEAMTEVIQERQHGIPVRLVIDTRSQPLKQYIAGLLELTRDEIYTISGPLSLKAFMPIAALPGFESLRQPDWPPQPPREIPEDADLWTLIKASDVLLHHPFEAYEPVMRLVNSAADDPDVLAIKMTLYRTSGRSPIIRALMRAAESGKQVTVLVELKARFDEERNIEWARQLERAGAIVIYGLARLKVHAKAIMVVRREPRGVVRYVHLGTGNYNRSTARLYTDMGLMTSSDEITYEVALFFNSITGCSTTPDLHKLFMAPTALRGRLTQLIEREIERSTPHQRGLIMAKLNSLACPAVIRALYQASQAGVCVMLNVRGVCCLRPGVPGLSENITVVSIIDRFLEHTRLFYFQNSNNPEEVYLSSADWMPRNLDRRVELMFPVESSRHVQRLTETLHSYFRDNVKARHLQPDGTYERVVPQSPAKPYRVQEELYQEAVLKAEASQREAVRGFVVRRKPPKSNS